jgi:hypothetical protein
VRTKCQTELGNVRRNNCASRDRTKADLRVHVGASIEGDGRACGYRERAIGVCGALDGRIEQITRFRKVNRSRFRRDGLIERGQAYKVSRRTHVRERWINASYAMSMMGRTQRHVTSRTKRCSGRWSGTTCPRVPATTSSHWRHRVRTTL